MFAIADSAVVPGSACLLLLLFCVLVVMAAAVVRRSHLRLLRVKLSFDGLVLTRQCLFRRNMLGLLWGGT